MRIKRLYIDGVGRYMKPTEVFLPNGIIVVTGETGVGKTMLMQTPYYALYGKDPYRDCPIQDLFSKQSVDVYVDFETSAGDLSVGRHYDAGKFVSGVVIRGDTVEYSTPKVTTFTRYINNIFGSYKTVVLTTLRVQGSSSGFFSMDQKYKRSFLIDILIPPSAYKLISKVHDYFKEKLRDTETEISKIEGIMELVDVADVPMLKKKLKQYKRELDKLKKSKEDIDRQLARVSEIKKSIKALEQNLFDEYDVACDENTRMKCKLYLATIDKTMQNKKLIKKLEAQIKDITNSTSDYRSIISKIKETQSAINDLESEIAESTKLSRKDKKAMIEKYTKLQDDLTIYTSLVKIFGDRGMPSFILNSRLPLLEHSVNMMLDKINPSMKEPISIRLKSIGANKSGGIKSSIQIDVVVGSKTIPYSSLSGGQKALVESAFSIGSAIFMRRYTKTDFRFIILDEPTIGMDYELSGVFYNAIREIVKDSFEQVIIITHDDSIVEMADYVLKLPLDK